MLDERRVMIKNIIWLLERDSKDNAVTKASSNAEHKRQYHEFVIKVAVMAEIQHVF